MQLQLPDRALSLDPPVVMGILNVTPDSFSDGGRHLGKDAALRRAREMIAEGARIIDVGGESTRPGAMPVSADEEMARVVPVIEALRRESDAVVSVDTMKPAVMRAACAAGAEMVNDVLALQAPGALAAVSDSRVAVCLMHMRGEPQTMQASPRYEDVVTEVADFLAARVQACVAAGIAHSRICIDPGIGFGKTLSHNLSLLSRIDALRPIGSPVLIGVSRKSMFGKLLGRDVSDRLPGALAATAVAVWQGAAIVRTHDVRASCDAVRVARALAQAKDGL